MNGILTRFQLGRADKAEKNQFQNVFKGAWLIWQPPDWCDLQLLFCLFVCSSLSKKKALHRQNELMDETTSESGTGHNLNVLLGGR